MTKLNKGMEVWFWYEDDGIKEVWHGNLEEYHPETKKWDIISPSWVDLEDDEDGPYEVVWDIPEDQIFLKMDDAVQAVGDITMAEVRASIEQYMADQKDYQQRWEAKHGHNI